MTLTAPLRQGVTRIPTFQSLALLSLLTLATTTTNAESLPIFDVHIHYSYDAAAQISPERAIEILKEAGVVKALVSSSDDSGTQRLFELAPELIVPALRPYRRLGELRSWMHDDSVITYLEERLERYEYSAIGEFHAFGDELETPVARRMIELAKERNLILHLHGDRRALDSLYVQWPEARVLWAHAGFEEPEGIADALDSHDTLWADLSFRTEISTWGGLNPIWVDLFKRYPDRFMLGADTYTPERWALVGFYAFNARDWLRELPEELANNIASRNAFRLLTP